MSYQERQEPHYPLLEILQETDPQLTPQELSSVFPAYDSFSLEKYPHLWTTRPTNALLNLQKNKHRKVILLLSGIAVSGKDAIRSTLEQSRPDLFIKPVTATSRSPRPQETDGQDYYFYSDHQSFQTAAQNGEFIEYINQGSQDSPRYYGLPKSSLEHALSQPHPVICSQVEIESGWPAIAGYANTHPDRPFILKVFALPRISFRQYTQEWLPNQRTDLDTRLKKTIRELSQAAAYSHFILTNDLDRGEAALAAYSQALIEQIDKLLKDPIS